VIDLEERGELSSDWSDHFECVCCEELSSRSKVLIEAKRDTGGQKGIGKGEK
jgi:hypothetical protein